MDFTGERFVPGANGNIDLEHMHRYMHAARVVRGKSVLDIASGEGYGSAILARSAARVIGVDISAEAVAHAAQFYKADNLEYFVGSCAEIPLGDSSVDVVVSFETLEHHDQHEEMFLEIRRILKPGGVLIISSPDKDNYTIKPARTNEYHVKELFSNEFKALVAKHFKQYKFLTQKVIFGSVIASEGACAATTGIMKSAGSYRESEGLYEPLYWLAVASDNPLPRIESSVLEQHIDESEVVMEWRALMTRRELRISQLDESLAQLTRDSEARAKDLADSFASQIADRDAHIAWLQSTLVREVSSISARLRTSRSRGATRRFSKIVRASGLFDREYYLRTNEDVRNSGLDPLEHFIKSGASELRNPNAFFDYSYYLLNNSDVRMSGAESLEHYINCGWREGRQPSAHFDVEWYLSTYADVRRAGIEPLRHYLATGINEGRIPKSGANSITVASLSDGDKQRQRKSLFVDSPSRCSVAIGVVTYNNPKAELRRCLTSARTALSHPSGYVVRSELLLIDHGEATDTSLASACGATQIRGRGNIGFGAAHNELMRKAFADGFDYYIAVNPDGAFHPSAIDALLQMAQANGDKTIVEALQFPEEHPKVYDPVTFDTPWASGACMLITRAVYEAVAGFDERFFMYCDDVDISWRARAAGMTVKTCPRALFFHPVSDRPFSESTHKSFLASGIALARKWGGAEFESGLLKEAKRFGLQVEDATVERSVPPSPGIADFGHLFSFAPTRW